METELIVAFISVVLMVFGVKSWQNGNHLIHHGKKAEAVIFKNIYRRSGTSSGYYHPVVRFTTESKEWITHELNVGFTPAKREGAKVQVIYDPEDPHNVELYGTFQLEILPRLFVAVGSIGFILALLEYIEIIDFFSVAN